MIDLSIIASRLNQSLYKEYVERETEVGNDDYVENLFFDDV